MWKKISWAKTKEAHRQKGEERNMNLCSGTNRRSHDEICFEGKQCPLCLALEVSDDFENDLQEAGKEIRELENQLGEK